MDGLSKWDPFRELEDFQNRLSSLFGRSGGRPAARGQESGSEWSPAVDILEDEKEFLIKAELPEVKREDIHVSVESNVLTIRGERQLRHEEKGKRFYRSERSYGTFIRSFSLPESTDASAVKAEFKDGILTVHVAKSEKARGKQVEVQVD